MLKLNYFLRQLKTWFEQGNSLQGKLAQSPNAPQQRHNNNYPRQTTVQQLHKYSPPEVKRMLRGLERNEWSQPVMLQAATVSNLLNPRMARHFRGRERMFERLPYILYQYTQGKPCLDIAQSVSYFSDGDDVEETISFASHLIAEHLNSRR